MTLFNWHNDPSKSGTAVNVDNLNEDLMYLKDTTDDLNNNKVNGAGITLWKGTQSDYEALAPNYDSNTIYYITE
jgi:hypothetical protein